MKKKNCRAFEIICYVAAALAALTGLYMLWANIAYIGQYITAYGMSFGDIKGEVFQTIAPVLTQYVTYTLVLLGMGRIYRAVTAPKCEEAEVPAEAEIAEEAAVEEAEEVVEEAVEEVEVPACEAVEEPKED